MWDFFIPNRNLNTELLSETCLGASATGCTSFRSWPGCESLVRARGCVCVCDVGHGGGGWGGGGGGGGVHTCSSSITVRGGPCIRIRIGFWAPSYHN